MNVMHKRGSMNNNWFSSESIEALRDKYIKIWEKTPATFPEWQETHNGEQRKEKDVQMDTFADKMILLIKGFTNEHSVDPVRWGTALKKLIYECGTGIVGLDGGSMRLLLDEGFCESTSDFITKAREFDAGLKMDDISQALRNVWIMNCIQKLTGNKIEATPSVLSYSLLYPYTDNYLDTNSISAGRKRLLNKRFERRLAGEYLRADTTYENKLFRQVENIESQFDRSKYPMVYTSLLGIQTAQEKSLLQQGRGKGADSREILSISIEKGGSSVLTDAFLVNGSLTSEETFFMFGFGILLQLLDDLQDAAVDRSYGHATIFSRQDEGQSQEVNTNRLINFTIQLLDEDTCFMTPGAITIKEMMKTSVMFLLLGAVACNRKMYDRDYLSRLEAFSPLSFNYLKSFYKKAGREYGKLKIRLAVNPLEAPMAKALAAGII